MESKVVSLRVPQELLEKLDRLAKEKYPKRKTNRSQVILDAIEFYCEQDLKTESIDSNTISLSTVNDIVNKRINELEKKLISTVNDTVDKRINELEIINSSHTVNDAVNNDDSENELTVNDTVDKTVQQDDCVRRGFLATPRPQLSLNEAFLLAQRRGYKGKAKSFSGAFTTHKDDPNFSLNGIKRSPKEGNKKVTYTDIYTVNND